jgi:tetratricopeptide (TPR) repeat protein
MQLPVWQQFLNTTDRSKFNFISFAIDGQGPAVARPWVDKADVDYPVFCDEHNTLLTPLGINYVPVLLFLDEEGNPARKPKSCKPSEELFSKIREWIDRGEAAQIIQDGKKEMKVELTSEQNLALALFEQGNQALEKGQKDRALELWEKAFKLDPENWLIRKQYWALKNPERFYNTGDHPDYSWQKKQITAGR